MKNTLDLLSELEKLAIEKADGHYTLMRFTTNWGCCLGTVEDRASISSMKTGATIDDAISACLLAAND